MTIVDFIIWSPDPDIFTLPLSYIGMNDRPVRWYGLLFAMGFILSQQVMYWIFGKEGKSKSDIDLLTTYMVVATILGARLGHCLFYNPSYYLSNPIEILKIWEGGLASHGGAIGILIGIWLFFNFDIRVKLLFGIIPFWITAKKQKRTDYSFLWLVDRLVIVVALTGALIRTGNFMNSEMEGTETNSDFGVIYAGFTQDVLNYSPDKIENISFRPGGNKGADQPGKVPITAIVEYKRGIVIEDNERMYIETGLQRSLSRYQDVTEHIDFGNTLDYELIKKGGRSQLLIYGIGTVRHAAQLYEAAYCILFMIILFVLWRYRVNTLPTGFNFSLFMMMLWSARFVDEFFKMDQEPFEATIPLNMGQWLSIPLFLFGLGIMIYSFQKRAKKPVES
jgi:prolipoprotein diacylglyceryl transferase